MGSWPCKGLLQEVCLSLHKAIQPQSTYGSAKFPKVAWRRRETSIPCPMCYKMISSSTNLSSHVRTHTSGVLSREVMVERPGPGPYAVCGTGRRNITSWSLLSSRCSPASSVLLSSGQGRSWTITIEQSILGKRHFHTG